MAETPPDEPATAPTPRWVKVSAAVAGVLVLFLVGLHLTGNSPFTHAP